MKILLISPGTENDIVIRSIKAVPCLESKAFFAPHALAAIAALTPSEHNIVLHDEHLHGPVNDLLGTERFDIIGISLITNQLQRALEIAEFCKTNGIPGCLVIGGISAANVIMWFKELIDVIFIGEAEGTWPQFLLDYQNGQHKKTYRQLSRPDMMNTPMPRWEIIRKDIPKYIAASVQTSRGCPHDCSFCDVIYTYGRKVRSKSVDQVINEIHVLIELGAKMIMIADDNFAANRPYAKEVLRKLVAINNSYRQPVPFATQVDITVANDDGLLELFADSNFYELQIGIESCDADSLAHMNKKQNLTLDIREAIRKIQSYGIVVHSHLIIGSDADDTATFRKTADFVRETNITHHSCHPLMAPPGTRLWYELKQDGRIINTDDRLINQLDITSNVVPKKMTRIEMMEGMARYWETVSGVEHYLPRALGFLSGIKRVPRVNMAGLDFLMENSSFLKNFLFAGLALDDRNAFNTLLQAAIDERSYMMFKVIFLYTSYMMDRERDHNSAVVARNQAAWERAHPESVTLLPGEVPVSGKIREHHRDIFLTAFKRIQPHVDSMEALYQTLLQSVLDYTERFSDTLEIFDDFQREHVNECCDRILSQKSRTDNQTGREPVPVQPPPGFEREILDLLDHMKRYGMGMSEG
jgi:radical SAM superfamily enzyme YgiQ (UPF0313 family)